MNIKFNISRIILLSLISLSFFGCKKQDKWLDAKTQNSFVTPETLKDYQALLDNPLVIHNTFSIYGLLGTDNIYLSNADFTASTEIQRNGYMWSSNIWLDNSSSDWNSMFKIIEHANIVLDGLKKDRLEADVVQFNNIMGQALFYRAISYYTLSQLFCKPFDSQSSMTDLGLPIRTSSDVNIIEQRSSVRNLYDQMINDLTTAIGLLQVNQIHNRRPGKAAAEALLAKVYLSMEDYVNARRYADDALTLNNTLLDFNSSYPSLSLTYRFPANALSHPEVLFYAQGGNYPEVMASTNSKAFVDKGLCDQYDNNDLRKSIFYVASGSDYKYRGTYTGLNADFCGIANNEVYLIRAECNARLHDLPAALSDLNKLLVKRYKTGTFAGYNITDEELLLKTILLERRKELPFVGNLRWEDLRRLNRDSRFKTTIIRVLSTGTITLEPGSDRYTLPIPGNETQMSGLTQNPR